MIAAYAKLEGFEPPLLAQTAEQALLAHPLARQCAGACNRASSRGGLEQGQRSITDAGVLLDEQLVEPGTSPLTALAVTAREVSVPCGRVQDPDREELLRAYLACGANQSRMAKALKIGRHKVARLKEYRFAGPHAPKTGSVDDK